MTTGISKSISPVVLHYQFDSYLKSSRMYLLRKNAITIANIEMFVLKIESGDFPQYTKTQNLNQDWLNIEKPDINLCDFDFLQKYSKVLFKQDYFVLKKNKNTKTEKRSAQIVKQANTSKLFFKKFISNY